jgi:hypothetical protein
LNARAQIQGLTLGFHSDYPQPDVLDLEEKE